MSLRKVTPRALKVYQKHGLMNAASDAEAANATLQLFVDTKALRELMDVTFFETPPPDEIDDIDLSEVTEGIQAFLGQLSGRAAR